MKTFDARIHVLLASDAPLGLVIRRGPSKSVCTFLWDRKTDQFFAGQWLRGRIYERRCDLSPDGAYLIYFAMNGKRNTDVKGSWTAISKAPYLKAIALFPKGDCWHGGGLFTGKGSYWLNDGHGHSVLHDTRYPRRDLKYRPPQQFGGECLGVYFPRLLRDGWTLVRRESLAQWKDADVFEKPAPGGWILRKIAHAELNPPQGRGCYWDEHALVNARSDISIACPGWEWADVDAGRLTWAMGGRLFAASLRDDGLADESELRDFNGLTFEAIQAPY